MKKTKLLHITLSAFVSCSLLLGPLAHPYAVTAGAPVQAPNHTPAGPQYAHHHLREAEEAGTFVLRSEAGEIACNEALSHEGELYDRRDPDEQLHILKAGEGSQIETQAADGLTITLRGTSQLEANQPAKAAFMQAASIWQSLVKSPITIVIDIDFGPTRFGQAYAEGIIGATGTQTVGNASIYPDLRQRLILSAKSQQETNLYNSLPQGSVPTELGNTTGVIAPTSVFRSLGLLAPNADVASEVTQLGNPPSIGFNSAFAFDFDPSDGIDADKFDFFGVALHEIGHALGFTSNVGVKELSPLTQVTVTPWDIFRFRPGINTGGFSMGQRVLFSGGDQVFYNGNPEVALSTGRPDGTGGDGNQSSHWKDDSLTQQYLGIMDPTARRGQRLNITQNDLDALEFLGHAIGSAPPTPDDTIPLSSGVTQSGSMNSPSQGSCLLNLFQYAITVPGGATQLKIDLVGTPELDLFVRFNQRVAIQSGLPLRDFASMAQGGSESITILPTSSPALQAGTYYIAVGNCGVGPGSFNITATVLPTVGGGGSAPAISNLSARLDGDSIRLTGNAADADSDIVRMQTKFLDAAGAVVFTTPELPLPLGGPTVQFAVAVSGMRQAATLSAVKLEFSAIDNKGNRSPAAAAEFNQADAGGANIRSVSFDASGLMIVKGANFTSPAELEINGVIVTPPLRAKVKSDAKIKIGGTAAELGLRTGVNRVRLRIGNLYSNLSLLTQ